MKNPNRLTVIILSVVSFMVAATLFGEGKRQQQVEAEVAALKKAPNIKNDVNEIPVEQKVAPAK